MLIVELDVLFDIFVCLFASRCRPFQSPDAVSVALMYLPQLNLNL